MSNHNLGNQTISCTVHSCAHNDQEHCSLQNIQVSPCANCHNGHPDDESMCASYMNSTQ